MNDHAGSTTDQAQRAQRFRALHQPGEPFILANVWDAASAHVVATAGAQAIATSSGAVSWAHGVRDGGNLDLDTVRRSLEEIVAAAGDLPVSADIEGGYAPGPDGVAASVAAAIAAGVVGINLEDSGAPAGSPTAPLYGVDDQAARIAAARRTAAGAGIELFINVRTDVYLFGVGAEEGRYDDVVTRARAYRDAGADGLFVPGLLDLDLLSRIHQATDLPLNAMWLPGAPSPAELAKAGVARLSIGTALFQAAYTHARRAAEQLFSHGSYTDLEGTLSFGELNDAFRVTS
jgi:2-methylisocitrate lyase-like PEP mutase family enzyme